MYATVYIQQFTNREDFLLLAQLCDDDTGSLIDLCRFTTANGQAFTSSAWTVTDGAIVTSSATPITIPGFPYTGTLAALALTVGLGLAIKAGDPVTIADTATGLNKMTGYVASYSSANGALVVQIGFTYQFEVRKASPNWNPGLGYSAFYDFGTLNENQPILQASLANGEITVVDIGTVQIRIPESTFKTLRGGTYAANLTATDGTDTRQIFLAKLPVLQGGVIN
jgi:hypothetical protein